MKKENDDFLVKKYPKIFIQRSWGMNESCMYWGFECGDGWFTILDNLCYEIQSYLDKNIHIEQVVALQVKEKFGDLCFYFSGGDSHTSDLIRESEQLSEITCEDCGSMENVGKTSTGWISTICEKCSEKPNYVNNKWKVYNK
jgi:hypothetical protein